jgi:hypothetical protein
MTTERELPPPAERPEPSLFCDDKELRRRVAPHLGEDRWKAALAEWGKAPDFPRFVALLRGRFYPAVKQWLDAKYGVDGNAGTRIEPIPDGQENFSAPPKKSARLQARAPRPAVLDGKPDTRPEGARGFPRSLHSVAGGRDG